MLLAVRKFNTQDNPTKSNVDRVVMERMRVSDNIRLRHHTDACTKCHLVPAIDEKMTEYEGKIVCVSCARKLLAAKERAAGR